MILLHPEEIERLISCAKRITDPPRKEEILNNRHFRNECKAVGVDGDERFSIFTRRSDELPENFSVGLRYVHSDGAEYLLYRCNGPHGETEDGEYRPGEHVGFHEHYLKTGYWKMTSAASQNFGSFHDAIAYFMKRCNILEPERYFGFLEESNKNQMELFDL